MIHSSALAETGEFLMQQSKRYYLTLPFPMLMTEKMGRLKTPVESVFCVHRSKYKGWRTLFSNEHLIRSIIFLKFRMSCPKLSFVSMWFTQRSSPVQVHTLNYRPYCGLLEITGYRSVS